MSDSLSNDETIDASAPAPGALHEDPKSIGPFRILERIGEGGMGVIYKAEQRSPVRRIVALKVIKLGMDTREVLARFEAERQALALMSHANIARVLDAGATDTGRPWFAMEYVAGVPLTRFCNDQRWSTRQRLELFSQICHAIQHAHQKGIIHRDLKPSNILISLSDGKPIPKVIDFGIAKATSQALTTQTLHTQTGALIGTPEYMSPEQAQTSGLDVDTRTDIYSLGVMLYELLTGALPVDSKALRTAGLDGMARLIREHEPQKPSTRLLTLDARVKASDKTGRPDIRDTRTLERELRGDLDWIVLKAMEKDRTRRYESAAALAQDIERHLNDEPVEACPPSAIYRIEKFVKRHRGSVVAAAALLVALILGVIGTTIGFVHARMERDNARAAEALAVEQRKAAEAARESAKTANLFLSDMLISFGNPIAGKTGLDRAVQRLDQGWLKDLPETQMACRIVLGMFFIQDNEPARAEHQFDAVVAMARQPDGTIPHDISGVIHRGRGMAFWMRKKLPEAEHELRAAIDDYREVPGMGATLSQLLFGLSAVRQAQGDAGEAQQLLAEANRLAASEPTMRGYVDRDPEDWPAPEASTALKAGKFDQARKIFLRVVAADPSNHWNWYQLACLSLYMGDDAGYRDAASHMLEHFGKTTIKNVGERTAKICLLTKTPVGDVGKITALLDQAMTESPKDDNYPWFAMSKALGEYRAGRFDSALQFLAKADSLKPAPARSTVELIRAMTLQRLGQPDQARALYQRAAQRIEAELPKPGVAAISSPENWLICHILQREAQQLIEGKSANGSTPSPPKSPAP